MDEAADVSAAEGGEEAAGGGSLPVVDEAKVGEIVYLKAGIADSGAEVGVFRTVEDAGVELSDPFEHLAAKCLASTYHVVWVGVGGFHFVAKQGMTDLYHEAGEGFGAGLQFPLRGYEGRGGHTHFRMGVDVMEEGLEGVGTGHRVIVEEHEQLARSMAQARIASRRHSKIGGLRQGDDAGLPCIVSLHHHGEGGVGAAIVYQHHLRIRMRRHKG